MKNMRGPRNERKIREIRNSNRTKQKIGEREKEEFFT